MDRLIPVLKKARIFNDVDESRLEKLAHSFNIIELSPGITIFNEGDNGSSLFLIVSGNILILKEIAGGKTKTLAKLGEEDVFGEFALFDESPRSATAKTDSKSVIAELTRENLEALLESDHKIATTILKSFIVDIAGKLKNANQALRDQVVWGFAAKL